MTTYRTRDNQEFERYEKFTIKTIATLTWIPLLIGENRVRYFESSQLVEVKSPFDSGMVYCYPAIPQNFDSGLLYDQPAEAPLYYTVPLPPGFVLEVEMPADLRGAINYTKGVNLVQPTLWAEGMKVA